MKKKFFDKLKKSKTYKKCFALFFAVTLLLSSLAPISAFASVNYVKDSALWESFLQSANTWVWVRLGSYDYVAVWEDSYGYDEYIQVTSNRYTDSYLVFDLKYKENSYSESYKSVMNDLGVQPRIFKLTTEWVEQTFESQTYKGPCNVNISGSNNAVYMLTKGNCNVEYLNEWSHESFTMYTVYDTLGNATRADFAVFREEFAVDSIGYKYAYAQGVDWKGWIWKRILFDKDVFPYWDTDADGYHMMKIYVPYDEVAYAICDYETYEMHGVYRYYMNTIKYNDEFIIQPYIWYEDYYPNESESNDNYCVMTQPYSFYVADGEVISSDAEIRVYSSLEEAKSAYVAKYGEPYPSPSPTAIPTISPQPSPEPLPPTDDSESMGFVDFIKQFENLFNASGNLWKITYYCFAFLPQQILWCLWSAVQIFLAVMVIKWIRE